MADCVAPSTFFRYLLPRFSHARYMGILKYFEKFDNLIQRWPGQKQFGVYRFLPIFFVSGAVIEYFMIHWRPNGINFCKQGEDDTYKAKKSHEKALYRLQKWKEIEALVNLAGSSVVHYYYQPMADLDELVQLEFDEMMKAYVEEKDTK